MGTEQELAQESVNLDMFPESMRGEIQKSIEALGKEPADESGKTGKEEIKNTPDDAGKAAGEVKDEGFIPFVGKPTETPSLDGVKVEGFDVIKSVFSDSGIEINKVEDFPLIAGEIKTLRTKAESLEAQNRDLEDIKKVFENLPVDLFSVVEAYLNDEDYRKQMLTVSNSFIDFTRDFKDNDPERLIEYYYPGKYSKEDYEDMKDTKEFKLLLGSTQSKFDSDKNSLSQKRQEFLDSQNNSKKAYLGSVNAAVASLEKSGTLDEASVNGVKKVLSSGINGILSQFVDKIGNITAEGAERLALALYGRKAIDALVKKGSKEAVSKEREEILTRGEKSEKKGEIPQSKIPGEVQDFFNKVMPKPSGNVF